MDRGIQYWLGGDPEWGGLILLLVVKLTINLQRKIYKYKLSPGSSFRWEPPVLDLALDLSFDLAPEQQIERIENLQGASQSQTISKPSK